MTQKKEAIQKTKRSQIFLWFIDSCAGLKLPNKAKSGCLNHEKTKRTQTYPVNPIMKNAKQTQIIAFST